MRRFAVDLLGGPGDRLTVSADVAHHLVDVCRARPGQAIVVFDGAGHQATAVLRELGPPVVVEQQSAASRSAPDVPLWALVAVVKGNAMEHALRMGTEAGVTHFLPCLTARTVPKGDRHERWQRVVQGAAAQCGRADVPTLFALAPLDEQVALLPPGLTRFVAAPGAARAEASGPAAFAIGPEGGWAQAELASLLEAGWQPLGLGSWVLRADTAVAVAAAMLASGE